MSSKLFSLGTLGLALAASFVTLQGCAAPTVTRSSALEPGASMPALGSLRADEAPRSTSQHRSERPFADRSPARSSEHRGTRGYDACRRCSAN